MLLHDESQEIPNFPRELCTSIIPFAMSLESEHFSDLSKWMSTTWFLAKPQKLVPHEVLNATKSLADNLMAYYGSALPEGYQSPKFYADGKFRDGYLHNHCFPDQVRTCIANIISESRNEPAVALNWIKKIHTCYVRDPLTGAHIKKCLGQELSVAPVDGLDDLRDYILGQVQPKGGECSLRCARMLTSILDSYPGYDLESDAFVMASNPQYVKRAFVPDFTKEILEHHMNQLSDSEAGNYQTGVRDARSMVRLFGILGLSTSDLCKIAMGAVAGFNHGTMLDMETEDAITQMRTVFKTINQFRQEPLSLEDDLGHAVLSAVVQSLPDSLVLELSQDNDIQRTQIYSITGNNVHLAGMKDLKKLDAVMASDLGI
ncbi:hypothetical protein ALP54_06392 [Pseudomonas amygdali pv. lachrymans]|nr:hypothetical protein ALP54_06392 [Pseudomonas amygdali pv. lachrymans]